jgi:hypothetical protein
MVGSLLSTHRTEAGPDPEPTDALDRKAANVRATPDPEALLVPRAPRKMI